MGFLPFGVVRRWLSEALREFLIANGGEVLLGTADGSLKITFNKGGWKQKTYHIPHGLVAAEVAADSSIPILTFWCLQPELVETQSGPAARYCT